MPLREKVAALFFAFALSAGGQAFAQPADAIIFNADIVTLDPVSPRARALAITGARITGVYEHEAPSSSIGAQTRRIDARGRTIIPVLSTRTSTPSARALPSRTRRVLKARAP